MDLTGAIEHPIDKHITIEIPVNRNILVLLKIPNIGGTTYR